MFFLKKAYCRIFQAGFRMAMPLLPYRKPMLLGDINAIPDVLTGAGCKKPFIVTDRSIVEHGLTSSLLSGLTQAGIEYSLFDETVPNPTTTVIEAAVKSYLSAGCDALIGFGGGSSIDCAKAVGARIARPNRSLAQLGGMLRIRKPLPLLVAVPTTAGTGSETTLAAVVTDAETRHKYPIEDFNLIPNYAVLDPALTKTLPPSLTATTGMDALTHAIEAYIGRSTTEETRAEALEAVRLIFSTIELAYQNGEDLELRRRMLMAAFLAGDAFSKSYVGYVHAVAHSLGGAYNVAHGLANAVLLPYVLEAYGSAIHSKLHELGNAALITLIDEPDDAAAAKFIAAIRDLNHAMNIPSKLSCVKKEDIEKLSRYADKEGNPLYPVPVLWNARELQRFYYDIMEE